MVHCQQVHWQKLIKQIIFVSLIQHPRRKWTPFHFFHDSLKELAWFSRIVDLGMKWNQKQNCETSSKDVKATETANPITFYTLYDFRCCQKRSGVLNSISNLSFCFSFAIICGLLSVNHQGECHPHSLQREVGTGTLQSQLIAPTPLWCHLKTMQKTTKLYKNSIWILLISFKNLSKMIEKFS